MPTPPVIAKPAAEITLDSTLDSTTFGAEQAVVALAALAQNSRLAVFRRLVAAGPGGISAGKIAEAEQIPPTTLSFHLKSLAQAGLINARQEGRFIVYAANFAGMNALIAYLTDNCCGGNPCTPYSACKE